MEKFFYFNLGFFGPVNYVVYFRESLGIRRPEVFTTADVGDLF